MTRMCPIDGCKGKHGPCVHELMMIGMGVAGIAAAVAHWGLNLI